MNPLLAEAGVGLPALAALLLWPGLLIVRAPWPFVPFLSLSFWLVSWDWLAPAGPGRHRFLLVTLALSMLFSALRLLKPLGASRPAWPSLVVLAAALARIAPFSKWLAMPGLDPWFSSSAALLLVWRDGLPASYLPLYKVHGFGLGDSALAGLAADVSLLAGLAPYRSLLLVTLASEGLVTLALFAFARRFWPERWSALGAVTVAALGCLASDRFGAEGGAALALSLLLSGAALVLRSEGRSPRVAAGAFWAAGAVVSGPLAVAAGLVTAGALGARQGGRGLGRLGLVAAVATLLAALPLWRTAAAGGLHRPAWPTLVILVVVVAAIPAIAGRDSWPDLPWWLMAAGGALVLAAILSDWGLRSAGDLPTADDLAAAAWLREHSGATDVVCADDEAARAWIPALAGRAVDPPRLPSSVSVPRMSPSRPVCRWAWGSAMPEGLPAAFRSGRVSVARLPPDAVADRR